MCVLRRAWLNTPAPFCASLLLCLDPPFVGLQPGRPKDKASERAKPSNVKSYIVQYRYRKTGASRRKTIGQHGPLLTFHKAKERARIILADALKGNDPVADDRAVRDAPTMWHLCSGLPRTTCDSEEASPERQKRLLHNQSDHSASALAARRSSRSNLVTFNHCTFR
jgi:hypothetical protein